MLRFQCRFRLVFAAVCDTYSMYDRNEIAQATPRVRPRHPDSPKIPWHAYKDPYEAIEMIQKCHKSQFVNEHLLRNAKNTVRGLIMIVLFFIIPTPAA